MQAQPSPKMRACGKPNTDGALPKRRNKPHAFPIGYHCIRLSKHPRLDKYDFMQRFSTSLYCLSYSFHLYLIRFHFRFIYNCFVLFSVPLYIFLSPVRSLRISFSYSRSFATRYGFKHRTTECTTFREARKKPLCIVSLKESHKTLRITKLCLELKILIRTHHNGWRFASLIEIIVF
jgi:hypothetical protein